MNDKKWKILSRIESTIIALLLAIFKASRKFRMPLRKNPNTKTLFLMGNGPSFAADYERQKTAFEHSEKMAVNFFAKADVFETIRPEWYILADPVFFQHKSKLSEAHFALQQKIVALLNEKVSWKMNLIFPSEALSNLPQLGFNNPNLHFLYFNANKVDTLVFSPIKFWLLRRNWASVTKMNVLISATYCALNLGFKNLVLMGADHSWSENFRIDAQNRPYMYDPHFYEQENAKPVFLYKNAVTEEFVTTQSFFQGIANAFEAYWELQKYAEKIGATIQNASKNSYIDTFPRI